MTNAPIVPHLLDRCDEAVLAAEGFLVAAKDSVAALVHRGRENLGQGRWTANSGRAHGLAWFATYVEALRQMARWARELEGQKKFGDIERLILQAAFGEYLAQIVGGIPMSQNEIARPYDMGLTTKTSRAFWTPAVRELVATGNRRRSARRRSPTIIAKHQGAMFIGDPGLDDTMGMIREQFFRFAQEKVTPFAHQWHLKDELIPIDVVARIVARSAFSA